MKKILGIIAASIMALSVFGCASEEAAMPSDEKAANDGEKIVKTEEETEELLKKLLDANNKDNVLKENGSFRYLREEYTSDGETILSSYYRDEDIVAIEDSGYVSVIEGKRMYSYSTDDKFYSEIFLPGNAYDQLSPQYTDFSILSEFEESQKIDSCYEKDGKIYLSIVDTDDFYNNESAKAAGFEDKKVTSSRYEYVFDASALAFEGFDFYFDFEDGESFLADIMRAEIPAKKFTVDEEARKKIYSEDGRKITLICEDGEKFVGKFGKDVVVSIAVPSEFEPVLYNDSEFTEKAEFEELNKEGDSTFYLRRK